MESIYPAKLQRGDTVRIIAPARSLTIIGADVRRYADEVLTKQLGLVVEFGAHAEATGYGNSATIDERVADIHDAFADPNVKAIFTVIGGFNSNQLLPHIDWQLIRDNPKILCGYSDITVLSNAIYAHTGLVTYYGPHYSTLGQKHLSSYTFDSLTACLTSNAPYAIEASAAWNDDEWYIDQDARNDTANEGMTALQQGSASGTIIGGNLCTLNLLQGTPHMPAATGDVILFLEDDSETDLVHLDRDLESLLQTGLGSQVKGIVIGRFQVGSHISTSDLRELLHHKPQLRNLPIISGADFGHTNPMTTYPIGGHATLHVDGDIQLTITKH